MMSEEGEVHIDEGVDCEASAEVLLEQSLLQRTPMSVVSIERDVSQGESSPEQQKTPPTSSMPAQTPTPGGAGGYPDFPAVGEDSASFLNAMYNVFNQAMTPTGPPSGPWVPLHSCCLVFRSLFLG